jgi:hypothetical protein
VVPVDYDGKRWLVAPYGAVEWVHNARAAGQVSLRYGRTTRQYATRKVSADEAGPVLKRYVAIATKTRAYFKATHDSPVEDFVAEAERHPVFELVAMGTESPEACRFGARGAPRTPTGHRALVSRGPQGSTRHARIGPDR